MSAGKRGNFFCLCDGGIIHARPLAAMNMKKIQSESQMLKRILDAVEPVMGSERIRVDANIEGRICKRALTSPVALPAENTSTMDGFALRHKDVPGSFPIVGESWAGKPFEGAVGDGACVKIATGAWVPMDLDLVVPIENVEVNGEEVTIRQPCKGEDNIRKKGEEIGIDEVVIDAGTQVTPRMIALLTGLGIDRIDLFAVPVVGVLSTGDELRDVGENLPAGASYDANRPMLLSLLRQAGFKAKDLGIAIDKEESLKEILEEAKDICDALVTIGGASVGDKDLVRKVVSTLGEAQSWKVAIKPGKPLVLGKVGNVPLFGLPGNPSSSYVTFSLLVLPGLFKLAGMEPPPALHFLWASLVGDLEKKPGRAEYLRATLAHDKKNGWTVSPHRMQGSGVLSVLARANCLVRLPEKSAGAKDGDMVLVFPLESLP